MVAGTGLPPALLKYWSRGDEGGAKIQWGIPGDWARCVALVEEAVVKGGHAPLADSVIKGMCSTLHVINTGARPGHAPGENGK